MKFCVVILILKIEENDHFWHIVLYFKKVKNATEMQKKVCAMCGEGAVIDCTCQSGLRSFVLEIPCWAMLHGRGDRWKLIAIEVRQ